MGSLRGASLRERVLPPADRDTRKIMWKQVTLWVALAVIGLISGAPLDKNSGKVRKGIAPSSFYAEDEEFLSEVPGKNRESDFPRAFAVKDSSKTNSKDSSRSDADSSNAAVKNKETNFPKASPVKDSSKTNSKASSLSDADSSNAAVKNREDEFRNAEDSKDSSLKDHSSNRVKRDSSSTADSNFPRAYAVKDSSKTNSKDSSLSDADSSNAAEKNREAECSNAEGCKDSSMKDHSSNRVKRESSPTADSNFPRAYAVKDSSKTNSLDSSLGNADYSNAAEKNREEEFQNAEDSKDSSLKDHSSTRVKRESSFLARDNFFLSEEPGKNKKSEFPTADAIKDSSKTNSKDDSLSETDTPNLAANDFPEVNAVKGTSSYGGGSASVGGGTGQGQMTGSATEAKASASNAAKTVEEPPRADAVVDSGANNRWRNKIKGDFKELDSIDQNGDDTALFGWAMKTIGGAVNIKPKNNVAMSILKQ